MIQKLASLSKNGCGVFCDLFSVGFGIHTKKGYISFVVMENTKYCFYGCGFSCAVWSDKRDFFSLFDVEGNVL